MALAIAGSDSIGGAGIQADIKAMAAVGVHAATVITCITSQNTQRVSDILPIPLEHVRSQLEMVLADAKVKAVKTGMLYNGDIAHLVASRLKGEGFPLVVDPVLVAGVGDSLHQENLVETLKRELLPLASCVTPNRHEAEVLSGLKIVDQEEARKACERISRHGPKAVLLKGGHFEGEAAVDILYSDHEFTELRYRRIPVKVHGSGCDLSSFIAAYLAKGIEPKEAVVQAKGRIAEAIESHYPVGKGLEIADPLASLRREEQRYSVMLSLKEATEELERILPREWVPEVGINFAYALPHARYYEDVCALEGRIVSSGNRVARSGCFAFGASRHVARIVVTAMSFDPGVRSALNLRYSENHVDQLKKSRLKAASFDREEEPEGEKTMEWGTRTVIERTGKVPDVIFDRGGVGKEAMIRLLGHDPQDVLRKLKRAIR